MRVRIAATSFVLPGNSAWRPLQETSELVFSDFSEWSSVLLRPRQSVESSEAVAFVVFLPDVIASDTVAEIERGKLSIDEIEALLAPVLLAIDHALANGTANPLIVAWSVPHCHSAIKAARLTTGWDLIVSRWQELLDERRSKSAALLLLAMDNFFAVPGYESCFDSRNYYAAHCRLSRKGIGVLSEQISQLVLRWTQPPKKVLALDCDNTLWGGVIGEDGLAGIRLGQDGTALAYSHFQRVARDLSRSGTMLVLLSKNEEHDVWQVFDQHPGMVLRREDVVAARINWKDKSANLVEIADELGVGLDSFVLWDDNSLEREAVRNRLPEVTVPEVPADVVHWPDWLESSPLFANLQITSEDTRRVEMYQSRARFRSDSSQFASEIDFLKSIQLRASCVAATEATIARAAQLTNKTNQFNLRTRRYDETAIRSMISQPGSVSFLAHLEDKFGDHGQVGLVIASVPVVRVAFLDTFLLSCRVLGRHLEAWMLDQCARRLNAVGVQVLLAEFLQTERNSVAANFLQDHGLRPVEECDGSLREMLSPILKNYAGKMFAARVSDLSNPYAELYS